jgi:hypothetical protein
MVVDVVVTWEESVTGLDQAPEGRRSTASPFSRERTMVFVTGA